MAAEEADVSSGLGSGGPESEPPKSAYGYKSQLKWTPELHARFVEAVERCGGHKNATPKQVQLHMNVEGVSVIHVKSHLQKHRLKMKELEGNSAVAAAAAAGAYGRLAAHPADAATLAGMLPPQLRAAGSGGGSGANGGGEPAAKRMRTGDGVNGGTAAGAAGRAVPAGEFRPMPRASLADLAGGSDQLYQQLAQAQQAGAYPPFKPTAGLPGFASVPALAQLPSSLLAAAAGIDWNWLGQFAAAGAQLPGVASSEAVAAPAYSLPLALPLAAPASYPAAAGADTPAAATASVAAQPSEAAGAATVLPAVAAAAVASPLAMATEGLQLLAQLAAAAGLTPAAGAGADGTVRPEGSVDGVGAAAADAAGSMEAVRTCFTRLQLLLQEQNRLHRELQAVGENALGQLAQLRTGLEGYFANISALASAIAVSRQPAGASQGAGAAGQQPEAEGAGQEGGDAGAQQGKGGGAATAAAEEAAPALQPESNAAVPPVTALPSMLPGGVLFWEGKITPAATAAVRAAAAAQQHAEGGGGGPDALAAAAAAPPQQPSPLAALSELLKGSSPVGTPPGASPTVQ